MSFTTHQSGEQGATLTGSVYVTISGTTSGTATGATATALCITEWTADEERPTTSVMTTCDYDPLLKTTFHNDIEISRGLSGSIEAFSVDEVPEAPLIEGTQFGPMILKKYTPGSTVVEGFTVPLAVVTSVNHGPGKAGEAVQMFKFAWKARGRYHRGVV